MQQKRIPGFTLIELMITLVVLALLTTITYPYYVTFLLKSRRSDALTTLVEDQVILEHCYAQNASYKQSCTLLALFPHTSIQGFYRINLTNLGTTTYTLTASPIGGQTKDSSCSLMTVNQANVKTAVDSSGKLQFLCWNPN
jgi:type IV pilus assembly protein PilE